MDEYSASLKLKRLYMLEKKSAALVTERDFIKMHMDIIRSQGQDKWQIDVAEKYLDNLERSA